MDDEQISKKIKNQNSKNKNVTKDYDTLLIRLKNMREIISRLEDSYVPYENN